MSEPRKPLPPRLGFDVACILCGHTDSVTLYISDVLNFVCTDCDGEFDAACVRSFLGTWDAALAWLQTCPALEV